MHKKKITSYRAQICRFRFYIVCALLFQRFLVYDHHVNAHPGTKASHWGQEKGMYILTIMVWADWFLISLRQQLSTPEGMCFNPEQRKMSTGLEFSTFLTFCPPVSREPSNWIVENWSPGWSCNSQLKNDVFGEICCLVVSELHSLQHSHGM